MQKPIPKKKSPNRLAIGVSLGLSFGAAIGAAIGIATKNTGLWLPIMTACGVTIGIAIGTALESGDKSKTPRPGRKL
ncbi:MAG: hypothetical protein WCP08_07595 [Prolixibacteraceae bacterium]